MSVMDRFTKRAKQVLVYAQEEARHFNHSYVGTEHILLGLIRDQEGGIAGKVLHDLDIALTRARSAVEFIVGYGEGAGSDDIPELTASAKKVVELALEEARKLNHHYVGTEHLLLGLVRKGEGVAAGVLEILGTDLEQVRTTVLRELRRGLSSGMERKQFKTPYLDALSSDLTELAEAGKLDPMIGRRKEIERIILILSRRTRNNPVLIGEVGINKTFIAEGLGQRIIAGGVPDSLMNKRVVMLDVGTLMSGIKQRGQLEERLQQVIDEAKETRCILFIDDFHTLIGAGSAESMFDAVNILKRSLSRYEVQVLGATTPDEYSRYIERDPALERCFQPVLVEEPTIEETIEILRGIKSRYEDFHQLQIKDEAIKSAVHLSARYIPNRFLPDKAIDLIDEAASRVRMYRSATPPPLRDGMRGLEAIRKEIDTAVADDQLDLAQNLREQEARMIERIKKVEQEVLKSDGSPYDRPYVTAEDIAEVLPVWTSVPILQVDDEVMPLIEPQVAPDPTHNTADEDGEGVLTPPVHQKSLRVFYSYARRDTKMRERLETHLVLLRRQGVIQEWSDRNISGGRDWENAIDENLEAADIILLLVSADFLASEYCWGKEMKRALEKHEADEASVIPIILHPIDWRNAPFTHLQALPTNARPVSLWSNRELAWADVASGIRKAIEQIKLS